VAASPGELQRVVHEIRQRLHEPVLIAKRGRQIGRYVALQRDGPTLSLRRKALDQLV
jgi:hypothetical protein